MILVSYDGSADAQAAIDHVAQLMPGAETTVLTVWERYVEMLSRTGALGMGFGMGDIYGDSEAVDAASETSALAQADEGARRAAAAGLVAAPRCRPRERSIAATILAAADDLEAELIVTGTRGLGDVRSLLLGSVSHGLVQHADRAILVVPSPALVEHRHEAAHRVEAPA